MLKKKISRVLIPPQKDDFVRGLVKVISNEIKHYLPKKHPLFYLFLSSGLACEYQPSD